MLEISAAGAVAVALTMVVTWAISIAVSDVSIIDPVWGLTFVVGTWSAFLVSDASVSAAAALLGIVTIWGTRLFAYLTARKIGQPEDFRYAAMRKSQPKFAITSLWRVFGVQGILVCVIILPIHSALASATPGTDFFKWFGAAVFALGLFFETVGDAQLAKFKRDPQNKGQVMDRGLWRYTRHPNYFGDACVWWGIFFVSVSLGAAPLTIISPIVMTVLLVRVSGAKLLDKAMLARKPGYADYVAATSGFVPRPPKRAQL